MATTIVTKSGSGAPTASNLVAGELAVDLTNKRLYTENSSGTVLELGTNPASDVTFGDNTKAVFGDGSDLRIYHAGSHSTIENIGTGHLQIHTTDFRLKDSAGTESMILANADGNVQLYYDNAEKLATTATGIDVTGSVTADSLIVDDITINGSTISDSGDLIIDTEADLTLTALSDITYQTTSTNSSAGHHIFKSYNTEIMRIDGGSNNVGIGTPNPDTTLHLQTPSGTKSEINFAQTAVTNYRIGVPASTDALVFTYGGSTERMRLDENGNLGIGVSPSTKLHVLGGRSTFYSGDNYAVGVGNASGVLGGYMGSPAVNVLSFSEPGGAERMRIDASGNVGIGVVPNGTYSKLQVKAAATSYVVDFIGNASGDSQLTFWNSDQTAVVSYIENQAAGAHMSIVAGSGRSLKLGAGGTAGQVLLDASGNLLVGKSTTSFGTVGAALYASGDNDFVNDSNVMSLNRLGSNGSIFTFYKDTVSVGTIGVDDGDNLYIGGSVASHSGLYFGTNTAAPITAGTLTDAVTDLGTAGYRFKDLYLSGGVVFGTTGGAVTSKTLDDYEEGTWTPTITNSTGSYTTQVGRYTKIGNLVYVNCNVNTAFTNTGTTAQSIAGLPFASENVASLFSVGTIFPVQGFNQGNSDIAAQVTINTTSVALYTVAPATGINYTTIVSNTFGTTVEFEFSLCYRTA